MLGVGGKELSFAVEKLKEALKTATMHGEKEWRKTQEE